ncbi:MAG: site-2 protease family protein [Pseudomonadota bacterium]
MKWSIQLAQVAGVDIYVHITFVLLLGWVALAYWQLAGTVAAVLEGVGFILALFTCVILHELGHATMARHYKIRTRHITLLPIGGLAALEKMPDDPRQEMAVALAGPAVNLAIAAILWVGLSISGSNGDLVAPWDEGSLVQRLLAANLVLAAFNMIPALPMDGGRVLRALLAWRGNHAQATETAVKYGQAIAFVLGFLGLMYNPLLVIIAVFIWIGAAAELQSERTKSALAHATVRAATLTHYDTLIPQQSLSQVVERLLAGSQQDFPVVNTGRICGVLTQSQLLKGLHSDGSHGLVRDWMITNVPSIDADAPMANALQALNSSTAKLLCVVQGDQEVGILDLDNFMEFLAIRNALAAAPAPPLETSG